VIGGLSVPDWVTLTPSLPKTNSGKIMRRLLRKIATNPENHGDLGDLSALADKSLVNTLIQQVIKDKK